jgi:hypothetical protein
MILPVSCRPIARSSVMPVSLEELMQPDVKAQIAEYDNTIHERIGDQRSDLDFIAEFPDISPTPTDIFVDDDDEWDPAGEPMVKPIVGHRKHTINI